jgi:hypothetical protein
MIEIIVGQAPGKAHRRRRIERAARLSRPWQDPFSQSVMLAAGPAGCDRSGHHKAVTDILRGDFRQFKKICMAVTKISRIETARP